MSRVLLLLKYWQTPKGKSGPCLFCKLNAFVCVPVFWKTPPTGLKCPGCFGFKSITKDIQGHMASFCLTNLAHFVVFPNSGSSSQWNKFFRIISFHCIGLNPRDLWPLSVLKVLCVLVVYSFSLNSSYLVKMSRMLQCIQLQ